MSVKLLLNVCLAVTIYLLFTLYKFQLATFLMDTAGFGNGRYFLTKPGPSSSFMNAALLLGTDVPVKPMKYFRPAREKKQILVRVHYAGVNPKDFKFQQMAFGLSDPLIMKLPKVLGDDFSGVVKESYEGSKFKVGDSVFGMQPCAGAGHWGSFAEYITVEESMLAHVPDGMPLREAAAIPLAALTGFQAINFALQDKGVHNESSILIHAGAGGVGAFAVQYASSLGMKVYTTCSSDVAFCKALGASVVIDYKKEKFEKVIPAQSLDVVLDLMGGEYLWRSYPLLNSKGTYAEVLNSGWIDYVKDGLRLHNMKLILPLSGVFLNFHFVYYRLRYLLGFGPYYYIPVVESNANDLQVLARLYTEKKLKVFIDSEYIGLAAVQEALDRQKSNRAKGKIIVKIV